LTLYINFFEAVFLRLMDTPVPLSAKSFYSTLFHKKGDVYLSEKLQKLQRNKANQPDKTVNLIIIIINVNTLNNNL